MTRASAAIASIDISWITISILKFFGLARNVRVAKIESALAEREAA